MQSETGFPSSHQLKSYVAYKSRLKLAARAVLSADAGLLVLFLRYSTDDIIFWKYTAASQPLVYLASDDELGLIRHFAFENEAHCLAVTVIRSKNYTAELEDYDTFHHTYLP